MKLLNLTNNQENKYLNNNKIFFPSDWQKFSRLLLSRWVTLSVHITNAESLYQRKFGINYKNFKCTHSQPAISLLGTSLQ